MLRFVKRVGVCLCASVLAFVAFVPSAVYADEALPEIGAEAYIVLDAATGQVLLAKGETQTLYPASITKILTLGIAQQAINAGTITLDTPVEVSHRAVNSLIANAATIYLEEGEVVSVRDLMYGTQIRSANDAANVLAELLGGSLEGFADMMNAQAAALGLTGSNFVNAHGLPEANHYTTAYDMGVITAWAMGIPGFADWFAAVDYNMPGTNTHPEVRMLGTSNAIIMPESQWYYEGITGSKSGFTNDAKYTLVTTAERDGTELVCVVLKCATNEQKLSDTITLLDYTFANFTRVSYTPPALETTAVPVYGGGEETLGNVTLESPAAVELLLFNRLGTEDITAEYNLPGQYVLGQDFTPSVTLRIPNSAGQYDYIGTRLLSWQGLEGVVAGSTVAFERVRPGVGFWGVLAVIGWVLLGVLCVLVVLAALRILYVRHRRKKRREAREAEQQRQRQARSQNPAVGRIRVVATTPRKTGMSQRMVEVQPRRSIGQP